MDEKFGLAQKLFGNLLDIDPAKLELQRDLAKALAKYASTPHDKHDCELVNGLSGFISAIGAARLETLFVKTAGKLGDLIEDDEIKAIKVEISGAYKEDNQDEKEILQ